jgi:hypothetical protein
VIWLTGLEPHKGSRSREVYYVEDLIRLLDYKLLPLTNSSSNVN